MIRTGIPSKVFLVVKIAQSVVQTLPSLRTTGTAGCRRTGNVNFFGRVAVGIVTSLAIGENDQGSQDEEGTQLKLHGDAQPRGSLEIWIELFVYLRNRVNVEEEGKGKE